MIAIGFTPIGQERWSVGENYLIDTLSVISDRLGEEGLVNLFLPPARVAPNIWPSSAPI